MLLESLIENCCLIRLGLLLSYAFSVSQEKDIVFAAMLMGSSHISTSAACQEWAQMISLVFIKFLRRGCGSRTRTVRYPNLFDLSKWCRKEALCITSNKSLNLFSRLWLPCQQWWAVVVFNDTN